MIQTCSGGHFACAMVPRGVLVTLRPDASLSFRAEDGGFLYDCHSQRFATTGDGPPIILGFVQFFLAKLFGLRTREWQPFLSACQAALREMPAADREAFIASHPAKRSPAHAAEAALFAYPDAERFVFLESGGAFALRDTFLHQENIPLSGLFSKRTGGPRVRVAADESEAIRCGLSQLASGRHTLEALRDDALSGAFIRAVADADLLMPAQPRTRPSPGIYLIGHSGLFVVGKEGACAVDPHTSSDLIARPPAFGAQDFVPFADATLLTHGHFDHYHLPTLLELSQGMIYLPPIPRASIVVENIAARLAAFGVEAKSLRWGTTQDIGDLKMHVLPFYGEQFLTSETHPEVRNWGNCYIVEYAGARVLIAADCGFEPGHNVIDTVAAWVAVNGPIDTVIAQSFGLVTTLGANDADLQIAALTSAARAEESVALVSPERRVTLGIEDLPTLLAAAGSHRLILYGQFQFAIGQPSVTPELFSAAAEQCGSDLLELRVGQGVSFDGRRVLGFRTSND